MNDGEENIYMFDEKLNALFRETMHNAFLQVPELRSVVVTYDYFRDLGNAPEVAQGIWLDFSGSSQKSPETAIGMLRALTETSNSVLGELRRQQKQLTQEIEELSAKKQSLIEGST
jgi:hypothetical protein